jgi:chemotaxis protein MotB
MAESVRAALDQDHALAKVAAVLGGTTDDKGQGNAMRKGPGGARKADPEPPPPPASAVPVELAPSLEMLTRELEEEIRAGRLTLNLEPRGLVVSLPQATYFPSGEDTISPAMYTTLQKVAAVIQQLPNQVRVEGHTDSVPIHNSRFRSNWELSAARSIAMVELLAGRFTVDRARMAVAGYAENVPIDSNTTPAGRARNRRVDLVILSRDGLLKEPPRASPAPAAPKAGTPGKAQSPAAPVRH